MKNALHHALREHCRFWPKVLPLIVWALNEVPNSTTRLPPYTIMFGRPPRGSMALIKQLWTGEQEFLENLGYTAEQYVEQLKQRLSSAAEIAHENTKSAQLDYSHQYNLRSKSKRFDLGDDVLVLLPDIQCKISAKWQRGEVVKCLPQNEYLVKLQSTNRFSSSFTRQSFASFHRSYKCRVWFVLRRR